MKKVFVKTKNVKQLISMMNRLREREDGVPGMGLVYGEPGLGKTYAITWWAAQNDAILIRSANLMSARWLLEEMVEELGEIPYNKFSDIFNQVVSQLIKTPRTIIVDETDYLTIDSRAVETLRDIHDKTNVPIVLVGMGTANKRLQRHAPLRVARMALRNGKASRSNKKTLACNKCQPCTSSIPTTTRRLPQARLSTRRPARRWRWRRKGRGGRICGARRATTCCCPTRGRKSFRY